MIDETKAKNAAPAEADTAAANSASMDKLSADIQKFLREMDEKIEAKYNEYYGKYLTSA